MFQNSDDEMTISSELLLLRAVKSENLEEVIDLLKNGADPNFYYIQPEFSGNLLYLTSSGKIAEALIRYGADVNFRTYHRNTPLLQAVKNRFIDVVKILLHFGASVIDGSGVTDSNYLAIAIYTCDGDTEIIRELIKYGAKVNRDFSDPCHPLHLAVSCNHQEAIDELIKHGASFYLRNDRLDVLQFALKEQCVNFNTIKKLLKAGAICPDNDRYLEAAILYRNIYIVKELIKHGTKVNTEINSNSSLYKYVCHHKNCPHIIQELLNNGAKTGSYFDASRVSPMALAVSFYKTEINFHHYMTETDIPPFLKLMLKYSTIEFLHVYEHYSHDELVILLNKLADYATQCISEAQDMQKQMIDEKHSLFDYVKNFTNKSLNTISESSNFKIHIFEVFMKKRFPIYEDLILALMGKEFILYRISFLNISAFSCNSNVMFRCPDIVKLILGYLSDSDFKNFIFAFSKRNL